MNAFRRLIDIFSDRLLVSTVRMREKEERALAKTLAPHLDTKEEWPVPTAFLLVKAQQKLGEEPAGRTTMEKLRWIQEKLGQGGKTEAEVAAEEAQEAEGVQQELDAQKSGWKSERQGWVMGGSGLDPKYASGL